MFDESGCVIGVDVGQCIIGIRCKVLVQDRIDIGFMWIDDNFFFYVVSCFDGLGEEDVVFDFVGRWLVFQVFVIWSELFQFRLKVFGLVFFGWIVIEVFGIFVFEMFVFFDYFEQDWFGWGWFVVFVQI